MSTRRFAIDGSYRRPGAGRVLIAGSPLRLFTLSDAGARVIDAVEGGTSLPDGHERLTDRLVDAGALHPIAAAADRRRMVEHHRRRPRTR